MSKIVSINDFPSMIEDIVKASILKNQPNTDMTAASPILDMIASPIKEISKALFEAATEIETRSNLANAEEMSIVDLNELGEGNYAIPRKEGQYAVGVATIMFDQVSDKTPTVIPDGIIIESKSGLQFEVLGGLVLSPDQAMLGWNPMTSKFEFDVNVRALNKGSSYNIQAGELGLIRTEFTSYEVSVVNNGDFVGGVNEETNADYLARIHRSISSRTLETEAGYKQDIAESFSEVSDVYVAGKGDPLMQRDLADMIVIRGVTLENKHIGGMTDIYIRGSVSRIDTKTVIHRGRYILLAHKKSFIEDPLAITCYNLSQSVALAGSDFYVHDEDVLLEGDTVPTTFVVVEILTSSTWDYDDTIRISYRAKETSEGAFSDVQREVTIAGKDIDMAGPFMSVVSVIKDGSVLDIPPSNLVVSYDDDYYEGTSYEKASLLVDSILLKNGDTADISYSYNDTIKRIAEHYNESENRVITRDLMITSAVEAPIVMNINVKFPGNGEIPDGFESAVYDIISNAFSEIKFSGRVDESEIVHRLHQDKALKGMFEYIGLPFEAFYRAESSSDPVEASRYDGASIRMGAVDYPVIKSITIVAWDGRPNIPM